MIRTMAMAHATARQASRARNAMSVNPTATEYLVFLARHALLMVLVRPEWAVAAFAFALLAGLAPSAVSALQVFTDRTALLVQAACTAHVRRDSRVTAPVSVRISGMVHTAIPIRQDLCCRCTF